MERHEPAKYVWTYFLAGPYAFRIVNRLEGFFKCFIWYPCPSVCKTNTQDVHHEPREWKSRDKRRSLRRKSVFTVGGRWVRIRFSPVTDELTKSVQDDASLLYAVRLANENRNLSEGKPERWKMDLHINGVKTEFSEFESEHELRGTGVSEVDLLKIKNWKIQVFKVFSSVQATLVNRGGCS